MSNQKKIIIIAGPNGAGKTTFAKAFLPNEANCTAFINADLIAAGIAPFAPESAAIAAGRIMLKMIEDAINRGDSFAFETTLSGLGYARMIPKWCASGYFVELFFLALPNAEEAITRVARRVREGGHSIPTDVIKRRFSAGLDNLHNVYKPLVNAWSHIDNSVTPYVVIDWSEQ
jgi:predicted ABC-type ATPase